MSFQTTLTVKHENVKTLSKQLKHLAACTAKHDVRLYFCGAFLSFKNNELQGVSTDGYSAHIVGSCSEFPEKTEQALISTDNLKRISKVLKMTPFNKATEALGLEFTLSLLPVSKGIERPSLAIETRGVRVEFESIQVEAPNFSRVVPKDFKHGEHGCPLFDPLLLERWCKTVPIAFYSRTAQPPRLVIRGDLGVMSTQTMCGKYTGLFMPIRSGA